MRRRCAKLEYSGAVARGADTRQEAAMFRLLSVLIVAFAIVLMPLSGLSAQELAPFKDKLFAYPGILENRDGGAYLKVDYREMRDINGRDKVPELRVNRRYVDLRPRRQQSEGTLNTPAGPIRYVIVGKPERARIVTAFVHGRGGNRDLGANDYRFGGNFNRIKNLMIRNQGVYLSMDADKLDEAAARRVGYLLTAVLDQTPGAKLVLACGSAGGAICHVLSRDNALSGRMAGMALLGSYGVDAFFSSPFYKARVPLFIAHGSADSVIPVGTMEAFYERVRGAGYPVRMVRFETGSHGTPIRMTDWRDTINWMLRAS
jgi:hypothetical protein